MLLVSVWVASLDASFKHSYTLHRFRAGNNRPIGLLLPGDIFAFGGGVMFGALL